MNETSFKCCFVYKMCHLFYWLSKHQKYIEGEIEERRQSRYILWYHRCLGEPGNRGDT